MLPWVILHPGICKVLSDTVTTSVAISRDGQHAPCFIEEETEARDVPGEEGNRSTQSWGTTRRSVLNLHSRVGSEPYEENALRCIWQRLDSQSSNNLDMSVINSICYFGNIRLHMWVMFLMLHVPAVTSSPVASLTPWHRQMYSRLALL